jgi:hypothetical protein
VIRGRVRMRRKTCAGAALVGRLKLRDKTPNPYTITLTKSSQSYKLSTSYILLQAENLLNRHYIKEAKLMDFNYDDIMKYMKAYFDTFNKYGQNPDTIHRMDDYFAPDFKFLPYVATIKPTSGREEWYKVLLSHPSGYEKLTPIDIIYDERQKVVVVLIKA